MDAEKHRYLYGTMAGRRPLTADEERRLLRVVRRLPPRDRALITAQWLTGFRISEILTLTVASVRRAGALSPKIGVAPGRMKGGYGSTRWVPVTPELARSLTSLLEALGRRWHLTADLPLFLSRQAGPTGEARPLCRDSARIIIRRAFAKAGIVDDGRLGTHTLRKTFARRVYDHSGHDLMVLRAALNHSDVSVTQRYLEVEETRLMNAIGRVDFTRPRRTQATSGRSVRTLEERCGTQLGFVRVPQGSRASPRQTAPADARPKPAGTQLELAIGLVPISMAV